MSLSRTQCQNIKGWAIMLIVIHNFVDHLMRFYCNEMVYSQDNTDAFLGIGFTPTAVWQLFAFVGWIGVALFLFLSGYGLTSKYGDRQINTVSYIKSHVIKLLWLLVPVYLLYFFIYHYGFGHEHNWQSVVAQLTFTINFLDYGNNSFLTEPGVYWFFGAIMQFYLFFLVIRKLKDRWLWIIAIAGVALNYLVLYMASHGYACRPQPVDAFGQDMCFAVSAVFGDSGCMHDNQAPHPPYRSVYHPVYRQSDRPAHMAANDMVRHNFSQFVCCSSLYQNDLLQRHAPLHFLSQSGSGFV